MEANKIFFCLMILLVCTQNKRNFICNGDFESYQLPPQSYYFFQNDECWYSKYGDQIQIKKKGIQTSKVADLSVLSPIHLCQKLELSHDLKYQLSFSVFTDLLNQTNITVTLDDEVILFERLKGNSTFFHQKVYFYSKKQNQEICFHGTSKQDLINYGALLDNVTIIEADYYFLNFFIQIQESNSLIILTSNITYDEIMIENIFASYSIKIEGNQIDQYSIDKNKETGNTEIVIVPNFSCWIRDISFQKKQNMSNQMIFLQTTFQNDHKFYHNLNDQAIKSLKILEQGGQLAKIVVSSMISFTQGCFCSYFILSLLEFWNTSLLYVFMMLPIIPQFTTKIYDELLLLVLKQGNFFIWIQKFFDNFGNFFEISKNFAIGDAVQIQKEGMKWFGYFEISTDILDNNYCNFLLIVLLTGKIFLIKLIKNLVLERWLKVYLVSRISCANIFYGEIVSMVPEFVISAMLCMKYTEQYFLKKAHKISQVCLMFFCTFSLGMFMIYEYKKIAFKYKQNSLKGELKKLNKIQKIAWFTEDIKTLMMFTTPLFLVLGNNLFFLIANSLVISLRLLVYIKNYCVIKIYDRIFEGFIILIWVMHQTVFWFFYILGDNKGNLNIKNQTEVLEILGLIAIATVLMGGFVQAINFCFKLAISITGIVKIFIQKYHNERQMKKSQQVLNENNQRQQIEPQSIIESSQIDKNDNYFYIPAKKNESRQLKNSNKSKKSQNINLKKQKHKRDLESNILEKKYPQEIKINRKRKQCIKSKPKKQY